MGELGIAILTALSSLLPEQEATLLFVGDAMQHKRQLEVAVCPDGSYDYSTCFAGIAPLISDADYAVVNLETPMAGAPYSGYPMFNTPDSYAVALKDAGFDMFLTANNHTLDRHDRGVRSTVHTLDRLGVDHIGTYLNKAARDTIVPFVKNIKGFNVGFLNYTYATNGISVNEDVVVDYIDRAKIHDDIVKTRQAGAELICVAVHWGDEYKLLPNAYQKSVADFLQKEGVEMIIGSHPHVIQPMALTQDSDGNNRLLVYSLGNFISNMNTTDTRGGALVRVRLARDPRGRAYVDSADYDMVFTVPGTPGGDNFRLVYSDSCDIPSVRAKCDAFAQSARSIFDKHNVNVPKRK